MLSKVSLFKFGVCYNLAAILLQIVVESSISDKLESVAVRPCDPESSLCLILRRAVVSISKTRPTALVHAESSNSFIIQGGYGTRNIAWPWAIHYAADYVSVKIPYLNLLDDTTKLVLVAYLSNILLAGLSGVTFAMVSRRVLLSPVVSDFATMMFLLLTPAWSMDPLSPFPLAAVCSLVGLYLFEGGSAQFAGAFMIAISSFAPGAFYLGTFAIMGFARNVWNFSKRTWSEFWSKTWVNRIVWVVPKAIFWIYMIFMQSAAALAGYFVYAVVFFLFNRIARTDNIAGESSYRFRSTSGDAGKLADYAKVVIQSLTIRQRGDPDTVLTSHESNSVAFRKITNGLIPPILVVVLLVALTHVISILKSRRIARKSYVFNRRSYRFWRFLPHLVYFGAIFCFTLAHHTYPDLLILLVTSPLIFWSAALLLRKPLEMDTTRSFVLVTDWLKHFVDRHLVYAIVLSTAFYMYPVIGLYRNLGLFQHFNR